MKTLKYPNRNAVSKAGVNFVRTVVESSNSIFNEISQQNDLGIDAIIELIINENPFGKCIGVQIKSGNSYFNKDKTECFIPIDNHKNYWLSYSLPVIGIVFDPERNCGFWVDIKYYLKTYKEDYRINFDCLKANVFDNQTFQKIFIPLNIGEVPDLSLSESIELLESTNNDEIYIGIITLFRKYTDLPIVWDKFIDFFQQNDISRIPVIFIYFLAHIPWHGDIYGGRDKITTESRNYANSLIQNLTKNDFIKLLQFVDENGFERGSTGQSVDAIIKSITGYKSILDSIVIDETIESEIREYAYFIQSVDY